MNSVADIHDEWWTNEIVAILIESGVTHGCPQVNCAALIVINAAISNCSTSSGAWLARCINRLDFGNNQSLQLCRDCHTAATCSEMLPRVRTEILLLDEKLSKWCYDQMDTNYVYDCGGLLSALQNRMLWLVLHRVRSVESWETRSMLMMQ